MNENPESTRTPGREARVSPRRSVQIDAQIAVMNRSFPAQVRSISASGVFAHARETALDVGAAVEIVLPKKRSHGPPTLRIPATVVRLEQDGVALRFGRYDSTVYTDLIDLIY